MHTSYNNISITMTITYNTSMNLVIHMAISFLKPFRCLTYIMIVKGNDIQAVVALRIGRLELVLLVQHVLGGWGEGLSIIFNTPS